MNKGSCLYQGNLLVFLPKLTVTNTAFSCTESASSFYLKICSCTLTELGRLGEMHVALFSLARTVMFLNSVLDDEVWYVEVCRITDFNKLKYTEILKLQSM